MGAIVNSINKTLRCTIETKEDFPTDRLPTLDTTVWVENGRILHSFFEKPTTKNTVLHRDTALSENTKMATLSIELIRRMLNTSERCTMEERVEVINKYTTKFANSGYNRKEATKIIISGLKGYEGRRKRARTSGTNKLHTRARVGKAVRAKKKMMEKSNWYKDKEQTDEDPNMRTDTTLFSPEEQH